MQPISRIDFSDVAYSSYIRDGFDEPEGDQRWSNKIYSIIDVPLTPNQKYVLDINVKAYPLEGKIQSIKLFINEQFIEEKLIDNSIDYKSYSFNIPAENIASTNHIKFEYGYTAPFQKDDSTLELAISFKYLIFQETN